jgi:Ni,Fe-hydrogenase I cytochrome b subunit
LNSNTKLVLESNKLAYEAGSKAALDGVRTNKKEHNNIPIYIFLAVCAVIILLLAGVYIWGSFCAPESQHLDAETAKNILSGIISIATLMSGVLIGRTSSH